MSVSARISCWLTLAVLGACSPSGPGAVTPETPPAAPPPRVITPPDFVRLPGGSVGPFLMPAAQGWLAAWAAPDGKEDLIWHSATFGEDGRPLTQPRALLPAPSGLTTLKLRALDAQRGLIVGAFESEDSEPDSPIYGLSTLAISNEGTVLAGSSTLIEDCQTIVWIDVVPVPGGAFIAWAEHLGDHAGLFGAVVDLDGNLKTDLFHLHDSARAWQLVSHPKGSMLGVVTIENNVDVVSISADGAPRPAQVLFDGKTAEADLDLAVTGDRVLVAFSDHRTIEPQLYSAWVSLDGNLRTDPKPMAAPFGAATLIGLRATADGAAALWHNTTREPELVRLGRVDADGRLTGPSFAIALPPVSDARAARDIQLPQLEATATGLVVMEPPCVDRRTCVDHADVLELSRDLQPKTRLTWPERLKADLVWDFQCGANNCAVLTASSGAQTTLEVLTTAAANRTPLNALKARSPQHFKGTLQAIAPTDELADLDVTPLGEGTLVVALSEFDPNTPYEVPTSPAPDGRLAPVQAHLETLWFPPNADSGRSPEPTRTSISIRARSVAGVTITPNGAQTALIWTALDDQKPQVFVTLLDERGRKTRQTMLTRQTGEILALAATTAPDGFLYVGWVRESGETNRAYIAKLNNVIGRQSADVLIAQTKGTISSFDFVATSAGIHVVLAENVGGTETLKWVNLHTATLQPKATTHDPFSTPTERMRFAPRIQTLGDGLAVAWLEHDAKGSHLNFARLSRNGETLATFTTPVPGLAHTSNLKCTTSCRVVITGEGDDRRGYVATTVIPADADAKFVPKLDVVTNNVSLKGLQVRGGIAHDATYFYDTPLGADRHLLFQARPSE
jgi:hypothetical protein